MGYFLGFDGGGTKTDCALLDASGSVVGEGHGGPSNPLRCGYDVAFSSLREAAAEALVAAKIELSGVTGVCAGIAGAGRRTVVRRLMVFLAQEFPTAVGQVTTDYEIALEAAVGTGKPRARADTGRGSATKAARLKSDGGPSPPWRAIAIRTRRRRCWQK
jgi:N-acetylglucosamine kinase-like BadF-type ATPase